jgi:hypothetical protein
VTGSIGAASSYRSRFALAVVDCIAFDWARLRKIPFPAKTLAGPSEPFYQVQSSWNKMMDEVLGGHGVISCLEEAPLERAESLVSSAS